MKCEYLVKDGFCGKEKGNCEYKEKIAGQNLVYINDKPVYGLCNLKNREGVVDC